MKHVHLKLSYGLLHKYTLAVPSAQWPTGMFLCRTNNWYYATKNIPVITNIYNTLTEKFKESI